MARDIMDEIKQCINEDRNFVLEAGAGAGKTYTLMQTIKFIQNDFSMPSQKKTSILCITFTNVAKLEIYDRLNDNENIEIKTLHEFLWGFINQYQNELKKIVEQMIDMKALKLKSNIEKIEKLLENPRKNTNIDKKKEELEYNNKRLKKYESPELSNYRVKYKNYSALYRGIISHEDLLYIAEQFLQNPVFAKIFLNSFTHIFIDEFQDTNSLILKHIFECQKQYKENEYFMIGLFGDRMQQIYSSRNFELDYERFSITNISKLENYRTCEEIIDANNTLRGDGFNQVYSNEDIGFEKLEFIYNTSEDIYLKNYYEETLGDYKRLFLTHNEIAGENGFDEIADIFDEEYGRLSNEKLLRNEDRDTFMSYILDEVIILVYYFINGDYQYIINNIKSTYFLQQDLDSIKSSFNELINDNATLSTVVTTLIKLNIINDKEYQSILKDYHDMEINNFIDSLLHVKLDQYLSLYNQLIKLTDTETMHGVKGEEFDKVIVNLLQFQKWTKYNFDELFLTGKNDRPSTYNAHKLLYVASTRAKSSLVINYIVTEDSQPKDEILKSIKDLYGSGINIIEYSSSR